MRPAFACCRIAALASLLGVTACQTPGSGTGTALTLPNLEAMRLGGLTPEEASAVYGTPQFQADGSGLEPAAPDGKPAYAGTATLTEDVPRALHWAEVNAPPAKLPYNLESMTFVYRVKAFADRYTYTRERQLSMTFHNGRLSYYAYASRLPEASAKRWIPQDVATLVRGRSHLADVLTVLGQPTAADLCRYWVPNAQSYGQPSLALEFFRAESKEGVRQSKVAVLRFDVEGILVDYAVSSASAKSYGGLRLLDQAPEFGRMGTGLTCK